MENKKPVFGISGTTPISTVTELHAYFRDMQSYYKVAQGQLLGRIETSADAAEADRFKAELQAINQKIEYFHVLNNAASIADTVLHTQAMIDEFRAAP
ncbi:MAG TPA: hypothetical protein V6D29_15990 [Leptolyngbyaceae cyanobacterium]